MEKQKKVAILIYPEFSNYEISIVAALFKIFEKEIYEKFEVPEYWIVNPYTKQVFVYAIEGSRYDLKGTYEFIEDEIKSHKFENLIADIKDIELYEAGEFDF